MLRFFLDNLLCITPPKLADSLMERLYYSEELGCQLTEITGNIIFMSDERDYLYNQWKQDSCNLVSIEIQKQDNQLIYRTLFTGFIFLSEAIFKDNPKEVECEIVDDSFIARINNNKDLEMNTGVPLSKNGVDISSYYDLNTIGEVFTYSPGGGTHSNRNAIFVWDAFSALIAFMTDGDVDFASDFFDYTGPIATEGNQYSLITGEALYHFDHAIWPTISFEKLYTDLRRCYNLRIGVEVGPGGKPVLRIEPKSYFRGTNQIICDDIVDISFKRKPGNSFDRILMGNDLSDQENTYAPFDYLLNTWKKKQFILQGACNESEDPLDLTFETICADVRVQELVADGVIEQDSEIFLYAEAVFSAGAEEFWNPLELYAPGIRYNNKNTTNGYILDRWQDDIYSPVAQYDYFLNDMKSTLTAPQVITGTEEIVFDDDSTNGNYDNGNTYDNTTGIYTCLITGTYIIRFSVRLSSAGGASNFDIGFGFGFGGSPIGLGWYYPGQFIPSGLTLLAGETEAYTMEYQAQLLEGTDISGFFEAVIAVQVDKTGGAGTLTADINSNFEVIAAGSGVFREFSSNEAYSKEINSNGFIDSETWDNIKANRDSLINIKGLDGYLKGYGQDIQRNILSGKSQIKLLGRVN